MEIKLYSRSDRYETLVAELKFLDRNMIIQENDQVPGITNNKTVYKHFQYEYSPVYSHESGRKINTRIRYKGDNSNYQVLFCKLNWLQRIQLSWISKESLYHRHPIPVITLILTLFGTCYGLYQDFFVYNDLQKNSNPDFINSQKLLKEPILNVETLDSTNVPINQIDTLNKSAP